MAVYGAGGDRANNQSQMSAHFYGMMEGNLLAITTVTCTLTRKNKMANDSNKWIFIDNRGSYILTNNDIQPKAVSNLRGEEHGPNSTPPLH